MGELWASKASGSWTVRIAHAGHRSCALRPYLTPDGQRAADLLAALSPLPLSPYNWLPPRPNSTGGLTRPLRIVTKSQAAERSVAPRHDRLYESR